MSTSISHLAGDFHSRRFLLHPAAASPPSAAVTDPAAAVDTYVVFILFVVLCALGVNSLIRSCTLRWCSSSDGGAAAVSGGLRRKAVKAFATVRYSPEMMRLIPGLGSECVICLSEYAAGERLRLLPKCHHGFHVRCIDRWLAAHSTCPTCRDCLVGTCEKIVGTALPPPAVSRTEVPVAVEESSVVVIVSPVGPEGYICNYSETSEPL